MRLNVDFFLSCVIYRKNDPQNNIPRKNDPSMELMTHAVELSLN
jgi:hypothetical protein